jgi:hypothetical protein
MYSALFVYIYDSLGFYGIVDDDDEKKDKEEEHDLFGEYF